MAETLAQLDAVIAVVTSNDTIESGQIATLIAEVDKLIALVKAAGPSDFTSEAASLNTMASNQVNDTQNLANAISRAKAVTGS